MPNDNSWLNQILGLVEGRPYACSLVRSGAEQRETPGIAVFHVGNGEVRFECHIDASVDHADYRLLLKAAAEAMQGAQALDIVVPTVNLRHSIVLTSLPGGGPHSGGPLMGLLSEPSGMPASSFGVTDQPIDNVVVDLLDIPGDWGDWKASYQYSSSRLPRELSDDGKHILVPTDGAIGARVLSGCALSAGGWEVVIQEIPAERRDDPRVTHWCAISRSNGGMTGVSAWEFFDEELRPFLCFLFADKVQVARMMGKGWTKLQAVRREGVQTYGANWLLSTRPRAIDLQALFQRFHQQTDEVKKHWRKVIGQYAISEEIMADLGSPGAAEAMSFAGLDGLARSIISGYNDKDEWLNGKLQLDPKERKQDGSRAGIVDAIELVLRRELGTNNPHLTESLRQLARLRNATDHTDLQSDVDWSDAYYGWNASQALVEILLLSKMGLEEIPNRTEFPMVGIMGLDVHKNVRGETILPRQCQSCGAWTGTITHRECGQNLCSECWEQHNLTGCTEAAHSPAD